MRGGAAIVARTNASRLVRHKDSDISYIVFVVTESKPSGINSAAYTS